MAFEIDAALRYVVEREGSDLHVKVASPPMARVHGALRPIEGAEPLTEEDTGAALEHILTESRLVEEFADQGEVDFSYEIRGLSRFRVNAFRQRGHISIACRAIPFQVRTIDDLGLPEVIRTLAEEPRGIVLLTGTTGSGKSTTLAAMIDHINSTRSRHVVTLEDPIEYLHRDKLSIINQREVGQDTESFARAMRRVLRQDPDVILIGEMRDEETVRTALAAAETGHLVLSTLHTLDATETINRIVDFFPPHLQQQARVMLFVDAAGRGLTAARAARRRQRPRRRVRGAGGHRPGAGPDPQPAGDRSRDRGDLRGLLLRDADLRPSPARARGGRQHQRGDRVRGRLQPPRLQADARRTRPAGERHRAARRAGRGPRRGAAGLTSVRKALSYTRPWRSGLWIETTRCPIADGMAENPCPVGSCAEIISGKWTLLVIRDLADGSQRFCELERSLEGISPRTLSLRLRALEEHRIVERRTYPEVPPRVEYGLTEKGRALVPLIEDMRAYGRRWLLEGQPAAEQREPVAA